MKWVKRSESINVFGRVLDLNGINLSLSGLSDDT